jgi:hypothetical protein
MEGNMKKRWRTMKEESRENKRTNKGEPRELEKGRQEEIICNLVMAIGTSEC